MRERLRAAMAREDGVSLIEMLAAVLILGVALAAFVSSTVSSLQATQRDHRLVVANALATEVVESLQGLPWEQAALYEDEAVTALGGTTYEGEDLVLIPGPRDAASLVPEPVQNNVVRDGFQYDIRTAITWVDDEADNDASGNDETGDRDDYKRFVVELEWSLRGKTRDLRVTALRSAETRERPLRLEAPDTIQLDGVACNTEAIELTATTLDPAEYVTASYLKRGGSVPTVVDLVHAGDRRTWTRTLPPSSPCSTHGPFPDGPVLFSFEAQDRATMEIYEATEMIIFVRPVGLATIAITQIEVDGTGHSTCDVTITVDVNGGTPDDTVTATWDEGPEAVDLTHAALTDAGSTFTHTYLAPTEFGAPGPRTVTVTVDRGYDGNTPSGTASTTVSVTVEPAADPDVC